MKTKLPMKLNWNYGKLDKKNSATIIAPTLFYYEITNALHRMNQAKLLTIEEMEKALEDACKS